MATIYKPDEVYKNRTAYTKNISYYKSIGYWFYFAVERNKTKRS